VDVVMHPLRDRNGEITRFLEVMHETPAASPTPDGAGLVGRSAAFNRMLELVRRVAATEVAVLLLGESGTGKELVAKAIHDESERHGGPFVPVECSGLTESLFESELFGHEKGAFTGAQHRKQGLVEAARGGTLFLDEVGDIPPALQVKLLRLLETRTFRPVGSVETRKADFRVVCATHQDLETHVTGGRFRADLYYRLATFPIRMPPLRERPEDLPLLAETLLGRFPPGQGKALTPEARERLGAYTFPGNIRELRNILERAAILADDTEIRPEHLTELSEQRTGVRATPGPSMPLPAELRPLQEVEDRYLPWAAAYAGGMDRGELATRLGLSERTLYRRLREARARSEAPETPRHAAAEGGGDALNSDPTGPEGPS
jgi:DNA-binding NtrC family response regulator